MKCPKCHFDNPEDTNYCGKCATPLPFYKESPILQTETLKTPMRELTTGSTFANRYQVIEELGKGGMGRVYKVFDTEIREKVALKLLKPEIAADEETIERKINEQLGDKPKAVENYQKFLSLWKDSDPGLPEVDDAKARLAALEGSLPKKK